MEKLLYFLEWGEKNKQVRKGRNGPKKLKNQKVDRKEKTFYCKERGKKESVDANFAVSYPLNFKE